MSVARQCPSIEELTQFVQGTLGKTSIEELERHFLDCESCAESTLNLAMDATLIRAMKNTASSAQQANSEHSAANSTLTEDSLSLPDSVIRLIRKIRDLPVESPPSESAKFSLPAECLSNASDTLDWSRCFKAAESTDELGRLDGFRVLKLLGYGGMGAVFMAEDIHLRRPVALKVMRPELAAKPGAADRFMREARSAAAVRSDHIVTIYQVGQTDGVPFLAQELLNGETLGERLRRDGRLPVSEAITIAKQIARGLSAAHDCGLIHRDIKPANVFLVTPTTVKLLDFGLARSMVDTENLTQSGMILGTPDSMAPEQARGDFIDARADLFSLGCVLYRMLTGQTPFGGKDVMATLTALATEQPPTPRCVRAEVPSELSDLVMRLLSKQADQRPGSANHVAQVLGRLAPQSSMTPSPVIPAATAKIRYLNMTWSIAIATVVCALLAVVVIQLRDKNGQQTTITVKTPDGSTVVSIEQKQDAKPNDVAPASTEGQSSKPSPTGDGHISLMGLDPERIPVNERFPWQPKELVAVIGEHRLRDWSQLTNLAFHPSGEFFISSAEYNSTTEVWSTRTLQRVTGEGDQDYVPGLGGELHFSSEGTHLYNQYAKYSVDLSKPSRPVFRKVADRPVHKISNDYQRIALSPDDRWMIIVGQPTGAFEFWDISGDGFRFVREIPNNSSIRPTFLELANDGRHLAILADGDPGKSAILLFEVTWDAPDGPSVRQVGQPIPGSAATFSPDGKKLVISGSTPKSQAFDLTTTPPHIERELDGIVRQQFSSDGNWFAYHTPDGICLCNPEGEWKTRATVGVWSRSNSKFWLSPDGGILVVSEHGYGRLRVWDLTVDPPVEKANGASYRSAVFSPDGRFLATDGWDESSVWKIDGITPEKILASPVCDFTCRPSFSPDSKLVAFTSHFQSHPPSDSANVWNLSPRTPELVARADTVGHGFWRFAARGNEVLSSTDKQITSHSWEFTKRGQFRVSEESSRIISWPAGSGPLAIDFVPEAHRFAVSRGEGRIQVYDVKDDSRPLFEVQHPDKNMFRFTLSPSGEILAAVMSYGRGVVWDLSENPPREYDLPTRFPDFRAGVFETNGEIHRMVFVADDKLLVTIMNTGIHVYDWAASKLIRDIKLPGPVIGLAVHPDGQHVATVNANGTVYILRITDWVK